MLIARRIVRGLLAVALAGWSWMALCGSVSALARHDAKPSERVQNSQTLGMMDCDSLVAAMTQLGTTEPAGAELVYCEDFSRFRDDGEILQQWARPGVGPDGTGYRNLSSAWQLGEGGLSLSDRLHEADHVLSVNFPPEPCPSRRGSCNGALVTEFAEPIVADAVWVRFRSMEGEPGRPWISKSPYKFLLLRSQEPPGIGIQNWDGQRPCGAARERYGIPEAGASVCVPLNAWDGVWATWDVEINFARGVIRVYRNGKLQIAGELNPTFRALDSVQWGANLNDLPPARGGPRSWPQSRHFDLLAVFRGRPRA